MNKYTLELKNSKLRKQYEAEDLVVSQKHIRNIAIVVTITVVAQVILLGVNGVSNIKLYVYFTMYLVGGLTTYFVSLCFLHLLRLIHTLNIFLYVTLILWSFVDTELKAELEAEKSITPFVRGFFLCIQFFVYNVSSYFPVQALMNIYIFLLLLISASQNPLMDSLKLIPMLFTLLYKGYYDDKGKKKRFLLQKKDDVWDHLTNELLPTSLIIVRWDQINNRVEFYSQNKQAQKVFKLQNTEDFNEFSRKFVLEEFNEKIERQRSLRKSEIKWDNTLLIQVQKKILKEKEIFDKCDQPQLFSEKDLSENNFFRKQALLAKVDNTIKKSMSIATLSNRKANSPINKIDLIAEQYNDIPQKETLGKIDYYLGEHRQKNFEVSDERDRYSVRIGAYFLNEWFGVISVENESFRDRYLKQKKQYQQLNKQVTQNYEYLLHCARQNIDNTKELYQKILQQQNGLPKGEQKIRQKGQVQSENNLGSYNCDRSIVIDTENTLYEPIKECSSYLENRSPIAANINRRNNNQNLSQPQKSIQGDEKNIFEVKKQKSLQRYAQPPPPTFGSEIFRNNNFKQQFGDQINLNSNNFQDQNLDSSSKNINTSLFVKKNNINKSSQFLNENQNNNYNNLQVVTDQNTSMNNINNNQLLIANQPNNKPQRLDIDVLNETCNTPISTKIINNPFKQIINQISDSTKSMYTALLIKTFVLNQIQSCYKQKKNHPILNEGDSFKNTKKANLKQVVQNITGLFNYLLSDRSQDLSIKYDENLPYSINQDQSKLTQLLFNCLNLMIINMQTSYQLQLFVSANCSQVDSGQIQDQSNKLIGQDQYKLLNLAAAPTTVQAENSNTCPEKLKQLQNQLLQESETDKIISFVIKAKLSDFITCQVANYKDLKINILEHGNEQIFAKNAIIASQRIIKEIGPYSQIKFQFDPSDCTFLMSFCIYSDLGVLNKRRHGFKSQKKSINNLVINNINIPQTTQLYNNNINANNLSNKSNTQNNIQLRDRLESQLAQSYNIMNISEEKFLRTKDDNFNQIKVKQTNCRTIQRLETIHQTNQPSEITQQYRTTNNLLQSPINQVDSSTHQRILLSQGNPQDKQFQEILKKQTSNNQQSKQLFNPSASLGLIDGNTQPSYIAQKGKQQDLNSSQEISQNQQRSILHHNSVSNIIQQHTNITID